MTGQAPLCWAVIPVKAPGTGKTRLAGALNALARERLVSAMLARVVEAARRCGAVERVCLVGPSDFGLDVTLLDVGGADLNQALSSAMQQSGGSQERWKSSPQRVIVLAGDLPQLDSIDVAMLADVPDHAIAIAPDRHGTGSNALSLPASALNRFSFHFGSGSFAAHRAEAYRLGYKVEVQLSDGLEKDIDEPADLPDAAEYLQEA